MDKHAAHVGDVWRVQYRHVKFSQAIATTEHAAHWVHLGGIETAQVEWGQTWEIEHAAHIGHIFGVQVF